MRIIIWKARVIQVKHIFIAYSDRTHCLECIHILNIKNTFIYQKIGVKKLSDPWVTQSHLSDPNCRKNGGLGQWPMAYYLILCRLREAQTVTVRGFNIWFSFDFRLLEEKEDKTSGGRKKERRRFISNFLKKKIKVHFTWISERQMVFLHSTGGNVCFPSMNQLNL